ncbi:MAG: hypothetical protein KIT62_02775 [Cyclobacteriaceae bacterium]|nr:hypothetical protein [Cyclobacteriaceae bacterium]
MGLFSFFKSAGPAYTDRVWKTTGMALRGMITDAMLAIRQKQAPVVLCYFEDEFVRITQFLAEKGVPAVPLQDYKAAKQDGVVWFATSWSAPDFLPALKNEPVTLLFFGHYPLPSKENTLLEKIRAGIPTASIVFYSSLDEPSFKMFGGERLTNMMNNMGMKEDEAIEHRMVTASMKRAREKVESMVRNELPAASGAEWFSKNVKPV